MIKRIRSILITLIVSSLVLTGCSNTSNSKSYSDNSLDSASKSSIVNSKYTNEPSVNSFIKLCKNDLANSLSLNFDLLYIEDNFGFSFYNLIYSGESMGQLCLFTDSDKVKGVVYYISGQSWTAMQNGFSEIAILIAYTSITSYLNSCGIYEYSVEDLISKHYEKLYKNGVARVTIDEKILFGNISVDSLMIGYLDKDTVFDTSNTSTNKAPSANSNYNSDKKPQQGQPNNETVTTQHIHTDNCKKWVVDVPYKEAVYREEVVLDNPYKPAEYGEIPKEVILGEFIVDAKINIYNDYINEHGLSGYDVEAYRDSLIVQMKQKYNAWEKSYGSFRIRFKNRDELDRFLANEGLNGSISNDNNEQGIAEYDEASDFLYAGFAWGSAASSNKTDGYSLSVSWYLINPYTKVVYEYGVVSPEQPESSHIEKILVTPEQPEQGHWEYTCGY